MQEKFTRIETDSQGSPGGDNSIQASNRNLRIRVALSRLVQSLIKSEDWERLETVLTRLSFLERKTQAGMVFELADDFALAAQQLPGDRSLSRLLFQLLEEALRRDLHFIARHPTTLFQCLWNRCWWYDCRQASRHYQPIPQGAEAQVAPWASSMIKLSTLVESWSEAKALEIPKYLWIRAIRPLSKPLGHNLAPFATGLSEEIVHCSANRKGTKITSLSQSGRCQRWDSLSGKEIPNDPFLDVVNQSSGRQTLIFSPSGNLCATCQKERFEVHGNSTVYFIQIWEVDTGQQKGAFHANLEELSPKDNPILPADCGIDKSEAHGEIGMLIWSRVFKQRELTEAKRSTFPGTFLSDSGVLLSGRTALQVWEAQGLTRHLQHEQIQVDDPITIIATTTDARLIAFGTESGVLYTWSRESDSKRPEKMHSGKDDITALRFSPDASKLAMGASNGELFVWELSTNRTIARHHYHRQAVTALLFNQRNDFLISSSRDGTIYGRELCYEVRFTGAIGTLLKLLYYPLWKLFPPGEEELISHSESEVCTLTVSSNRKKLYAGYNDGSIHMFDMLVWDERRKTQTALVDLPADLEESPSKKAELHFSPNADFLIVGTNSDGFWSSLTLWHTSTGEKITDIPMANCWMFSPDSAHVLIGVINGGAGSSFTSVALDFWNTKTGSIDRSRTLKPTSEASELYFSPDGRRLVIVSIKDQLSVWSTEIGISLLQTQQRYLRQPSSFAFTPDSQTLFCLAERYHDNLTHPELVLDWWDVLSGKLMGQLKISDHFPHRLCLSPKLLHVATWNSDGLCIWDLSVRGRQFLMHNGGSDRRARKYIGPRYPTDVGYQTVRFEGTIKHVHFSEDGLRVFAADSNDIVREFDVRTGGCLSETNNSSREEYPKNCQNYLASVRETETVISHAASGNEVAWFNVRLSEIVPHPELPLWAGISNNRLILFQLETTALAQLPPFETSQPETKTDILIKCIIIVLLNLSGVIPTLLLAKQYGITSLTAAPLLIILLPYFFCTSWDRPHKDSSFFTAEYSELGYLGFSSGLFWVSIVTILAILGGLSLWWMVLGGFFLLFACASLHHLLNRVRDKDLEGER